MNLDSILAGQQQVSSVLQMPIKLGIQPTVGNQLLMAAIFGDTSAIKYQHPVSLFYRRQAMGDGR